jgi:NTE family protein
MGQFDRLLEWWKEVEQKGASAIYTSDLIKTNPKDGRLQLNLTRKIIRQRFPRTNKNLLLKLFNPQQIAEDFLKDFNNIRSVADNSPLKNKLLSLCSAYDSRHMISSISNRKTRFRCGFVPLVTGKYEAPPHNYYLDDQQLINAVMASSTIPMVWDPVPTIISALDTYRESVDGGIVNLTPLGDVITDIDLDDSGEDYFIIIINCSNGEVEEIPSAGNIAQIALRAISDIAIMELFNNDIKEFININCILSHLDLKEITYAVRSVHNNTLLRKTRKRFRYLLIQPANNLGDTLHVDERIMRQRYEEGWKAAQKGVVNY